MEEIIGKLGSNIDWVALYIGTISIIIAVFAYIDNKKNTKEVKLNYIDEKIDRARANYHTNAMEIAKMKADTPEKKLIMEKSDTAAIEAILNAYEDGCDAFFKKKIKQRDFSDKYHTDIRQFVEQYEKKFASPITAFANMLKYYKKYHRMGK